MGGGGEEERKNKLGKVGMRPKLGWEYLYDERGKGLNGRSGEG